MKKTLALTFILTILTTFGFSQEVKEYKLSNGIPVFAIKNTVNKIDSVSVVVKGGVSYYKAENSGIEKALFTMMTKGSARYSYDDIKYISYETGTDFATRTTYEGSCLTITTIDDYLQQTLPVMLNGFTNPAFTQTEFTKLITNYKDSIQTTLNDPMKMSIYYSRMAIFQNHPYETSPAVTPSSLGNITVAAMKTHHKQLMDSRRIYVVAVTNAEPEEYLPLLEKELGGIKAGAGVLESTEVPEVKVGRRPLVLTHGSAQDSGYYFRVVKAPSYASDEYIPYLVAKKIYDSTLNNVMRLKYAACYGGEVDDMQILPNISYEIVYRCSDPTDLKTRVSEARNIIKDGKYILGMDKKGEYILDDISKGYEGFKNSMINSLYVSKLTTTGIALSKVSSLLMYGDVESLDNQYSKIKDVTAAQVVEVFNKYFVTDDEFWLACVSPDLEEETEDLLKK